MTKFNLLLAVVVLLMLPFGLSAQNCHITGRVAVPELQGKNIAILNMNTGKSLASTKIVDSAYVLDIEVSEPFVGMLKTDPQNSNSRSYYYLRIVGEPGNIYADLVTDSLSGTQLNDWLCAYSNKCKREIGVINANYSKMEKMISMPNEEREKLEKETLDRTAKLFVMMKDIYSVNKSNPLGALILEDYLEYEVDDYESVVKMLEGAAPVVTTYQPLKTKLTLMEKVSHTAAGKPYIDLNLTDYKTKKPTKLSKVINGKVALIDFWASWCGPCRREIPNIKKIHEQYGSKEFVVVSLNVWDKPEAQAKAIKDLGMTWTQLTDATRNATDTYGIEGIPQILLIGKDGIIIARDLRGEEIEKAVKKALGK